VGITTDVLGEFAKWLDVPNSTVGQRQMFTYIVPWLKNIQCTELTEKKLEFVVKVRMETFVITEYDT
jgi:hypothetical protein